MHAIVNYMSVTNCPGGCSVGGNTEARCNDCARTRVAVAGRQRLARPRRARRGVLGRGARGGAAAVGKAVGEARNAPRNTSNATPRIH
eukprot:COSAG06_NODE_31152_length_526_cov_0.913349_1_plen_87_part_10